MLADDPVASIGIADMLTVEAGYEAALAAALGDDLLAPMDPEPDAAGWSLFSRTSVKPSLPEAATPLSEHVTGPAHLAARLAQIGIVGSEQGATLQADLATGQRLVSKAGDLWRWDGFCQPASDVPSMAARRMEQRNRLKALAGALEAASAAHSSARASQVEAKDRLAAAKAAEAEARGKRADAAAKEATADRVANRAISDLETLLAREERIAEKRAAGIADRDAAAEALANAESRQDALGDPSEAEANREAAHDRLATARSATMAARGQLEGLRRDAAGRERRLVAIRRESRAWEERGTQAKTRTADLERRLEETQAAVERAASAPDALTERTAKLDGEIAAAEARVEKARAALTAGEGALREAEAEERRAERAASEAREHRARREAEAEAAGARQAEAASAVRETLRIDPDTLPEVTELSTDGLPTAEAAEQEAAKLRRQREALGAVNLRAEADAEELTTEREGLEVERADLEAAIGKLRIGVRGLNREGRERLLAAFDAVNEKFGTLFRHLFGGGEARLILVDSEDPLEAGLEILCQPPGKKLSTLSLLSGGEQTLTALSLIFAVFLCNPAPICVLDEVDAPLDDANVLRFCNLLDEMVRQTSTRFLIITHHAITMSRMDRLYGVTMVEQGVSRLVSVDLTRAAEMVDG
ncbi:MAG: chromosome segregation protein SMC, partial [Pseudomonadota bacterium]